MSEELYQKLYYLSFSDEKEAGTMLAEITETFNQAMSLRKTTVCQKTSDGYSVVALSGESNPANGQEGLTYIITNSYGRELGKLHLLPGENAGFTMHQSKIITAFINQLAGILELFMPKETEANFYMEVDRYKRLLATDKLTGLYNRYYFDETIEQIRKEKQYPLSLVFVDVDGLKIINDYLGHKYGDLALQQTAMLLKSTFRENDIIARLGGDEFVIVLPFTPQKSAEARCKSLTEALKSYNRAKNTPPLSFSVGIAATDGTETVEDLLHRADLEMYKQKQKNLLRYGNFVRSRCLSLTAEAGSSVSAVHALR